MKNNLPCAIKRFSALSDGTSEGFRELASFYLKSAVEQLSELKKAVHSADPKNAERIAHSAAGVNDTVGFFDLGSLFRRVEEKAGHGDLGRAGPVLQMIDAEFEKVKQLLNAYSG